MNKMTVESLWMWAILIQFRRSVGPSFPYPIYGSYGNSSKKTATFHDKALKWEKGGGGGVSQLSIFCIFISMKKISSVAKQQ